MAMAAGNVRNVPPELEQLKAELGPPDEFDLQSCRKESCWLLNNPIRINKIISHIGAHLNEEPPGELRLTWGFAYYNSSAVQVLLFLIKWHSCIVHFECSKIEVTPLVEALTALKDRTDIKSFSVTHQDIDCSNNTAGYPLEPLLVNLVDKSANLTYFKLIGERKRGRNGREIGEALAKKVALEEMDLKYGGIMEYFVDWLVENMRTTSLRKFTSHTADLLVQKVAKLIKLSPKLSCLELFYVKLCKIGQRGIERASLEEVAKALWDNESVKTLRLVCCSLTSDDQIALAEMLLHNETLTELDISSNWITKNVGRNMARSLKTTATLKNLVIDDCKIVPDTLTEIIAALKENPQGPVLSFRDRIPDELLRIFVEEREAKVEFHCTEKVVKMLTGVPDWYDVTDISISAKDLSEAEMQSVCTYLGQGSSRVKRCNFKEPKEPDCLQLAGLLLNNAVVEEFTLVANAMSTETLRAWAEVVASNTHLRSLRIKMSPETQVRRYADVEEALLLAEALKRNRTLEEFECDLVFKADMERLFSEHLASNYALTEFTFYMADSTQFVMQDHPIALRNKVLQQQALHYVREECSQQRWAGGFFLTRHTPTLRRKLQEKTGESGEKVQDMIGLKFWYLCDNLNASQLSLSAS